MDRDSSQRHIARMGSISMVCDKETEMEHMGYMAVLQVLCSESKGAAVKTNARAIPALSNLN